MEWPYTAVNPVSPPQVAGHNARTTNTSATARATDPILRDFALERDRTDDGSAVLPADRVFERSSPTGGIIPATCQGRSMTTSV
ncbi:hypothetical protein GCM10009785_09050 [Brooklawnia cerclae]